MQISSLISALTSSAASGQTAASQMASGTSFQADPAAGQQLPVRRHHQNHALTSTSPLQLFDIDPPSTGSASGGVGVGASAYGAAEAKASSAGG